MKRIDNMRFAIIAGPSVSLRRYAPCDAQDLLACIDASFRELHAWMDWAQELPDNDSVGSFLTRAIDNSGTQGSYDFAIVMNATKEKVVGCRLMARIGPDALEIGYWVDSRYV